MPRADAAAPDIIPLLSSAAASRGNRCAHPVTFSASHPLANWCPVEDGPSRSYRLGLSVLVHSSVRVSWWACSPSQFWGTPGQVPARCVSHENSAYPMVECVYPLGARGSGGRQSGAVAHAALASSKSPTHCVTCPST